MTIFNTKVRRFLFIKINIRSHYKRGLNNNSLVFGFYFYHSSFNNNTFGFTNLQHSKFLFVERNGHKL